MRHSSGTSFSSDTRADTSGCERDIHCPFHRYNVCMDTSSLTPKPARFVEEYALDHDRAAATVRAGYSPRTARQITYEC